MQRTLECPPVNEEYPEGPGSKGGTNICMLGKIRTSVVQYKVLQIYRQQLIVSLVLGILTSPMCYTSDG